MAATTSWGGGRAGHHARCVLAPNPGPMTLEGTNTWVLTGPDGAVVVDPGPKGAPDHLRAVRAAAGGDVTATLLTHHHADHTGALEEWAASVTAPVRGAGRGSPWEDGERLEVAGLALEVVLAPGHTPDSVCLLLDDGVLLTGDTVLGRGTSVVPWPEGDLGAYLSSLDRLLELARSGQARQLAPGHGPVVDNPVEHLEALRTHRFERLRQVRDALAAGARTAADVVAAVYGPLEPTLARAATSSVRAQLAHLGHATD
ncbi:MBL fold metallo-hydrolase [Georgenia sp. H159]|uniref:MBL fold metallo-hydrolase n=1 Tax=Georgenia sp. H159 TaxID=3076115 RepID=UPI002D776EB6|nr:MBL fold metallo-hydrolase [Georgenia sp. H159]